MANPTSTWICDNCRQVIVSDAHGWVEWLHTVSSNPSTKVPGRGLRLVHHVHHSPIGGCQYDGKAEHTRDGSILGDMTLRHFQGHDGLMRLLEMISDNILPSDEIIEMIKRIHIPGYEYSRNYFSQAIADDAFEPNTKPSFYIQSHIDSTLEWMNRNGIATH